MHLSFLLPMLCGITVLAINPRLLAREDDICLHQSDLTTYLSHDVTKTAEFWNTIKGNDILSTYIKKEGDKDWANKFLGTPYDCGNFPASSNCRSPDQNSCEKYDPKEKYYVHVAMSNLYNAFVRWHEALQDTAIAALASDIKEITENWGPPEPKESDLASLVIGAIITLSGFSEAKFAEVLGAALEVWESVREFTKIDPESPDDVNDALEKKLGEVFKQLQGDLDATVKRIFTGDRPKVGGQWTPPEGGFGGISKRIVVHPETLIANYFTDGAFLNSLVVNDAVDQWIKNAQALILEGLAVEAMKATKVGGATKTVLLSDRRPNIDENFCKSSKLTQWDAENKTCIGFGTVANPGGSVPFNGGTTEPTYNFWNDDEIFKAQNTFRSLSAALRNAVECSKKPENQRVADFPKPDFEKLNADYPPCFFSLETFTQS